jgi:hypothetical protein
MGSKGKGGDCVPLVSEVVVVVIWRFLLAFGATLVLDGRIWSKKGGLEMVACYHTMRACNGCLYLWCYIRHPESRYIQRLELYCSAHSASDNNGFDCG